MSTASAVEFKELVRSRTDIVALIGESVTLNSQRGGRMFVGLCPFHPDHNPSLQVNPERQSYRCWVCNKGGDCFSFVMEHENLQFVDAIEMLAQRAGLELPRFTRQPGEAPSEKAPLYDVLKWAEGVMHEFLVHAQPAEKARRYLLERGFTPETALKFRLGFHPEAGEWLMQRANGRFSIEQLEAARLIKKSDYGNGYYGEFRDRVVFPICDERGRTVAFGGRILPDTSVKTQAKYYNSRESAVFPKSRVVYGLNWARDAIKEAGFAVVVEGYADCVKLHQAGFGNTLATLGTSLTETQVSVMKRFTPRIVLLYDGDDAGVRAAKRAVDLFLAQDVELRVLVLPDQLDPDEYIEGHGSAALKQLIASAPEAWEFYYQQLLAEHGAASIHARMQVLEGLLELLTQSPRLEGSPKEGLLVRSISQKLGMNEIETRQRLGELRRQHQRAAARRNVAAEENSPGSSDRNATVVALQRSSRGDDILECEFLQVLFTDPHRIEAIRSEVGPDDFRNELLRELWTISADLAEEGNVPAFDRVLSRIECPDLKSLAVWIDEQAHARNLAGMLSREAAADGQPDLIFRLLGRLKLRRERTPHESLRLDFLNRAPSLDEESRKFLQRATQFHERRAT